MVFCVFFFLVVFWFGVFSSFLSFSVWVLSFFFSLSFLVYFSRLHFLEDSRTRLELKNEFICVT